MYKSKIRLIDNQKSPSSPGPAIGGSISGVVIIIILVVLAVIIYR